MKGGVAVALRLAHSVPEPDRDVTFVFYECEEIDDVYNGLGKIASERPDLVEADFAILMEPSDAVVEAGCQGTLRVDVTVRGQRAHSARSWRGINAIHGAGEVLRRLGEYEARQPVIDGLEYHEGLNAVHISGGVASNVLPDECVVTVNYRYAPDRSEAEAQVFVKEFFDGFEIEVTDSAPAALPGLEVPAASAFVEAVGGKVNPKFGWTDVARFTGLGVPAVNYGPGDPMLAHKQEEFVPIEQLHSCEDTLRTWLGGGDEPPARPPRSEDPTHDHPAPWGEASWADPAARVAGRPDHHRPATAGLPGCHRLGAHRSVAGAPHPVRVRRGLRRPGRARPCHRRLRFGPHPAR